MKRLVAEALARELHHPRCRDTANSDCGAAISYPAVMHSRTDFFRSSPDRFFARPA